MSLFSSSKSISVSFTAEIHVSPLQPTVHLLHSGMNSREIVNIKSHGSKKQ